MDDCFPICIVVKFIIIVCIKMYPCISGICLSLCILVYQASAACLLHTMGHCLLPFPVSSPCPIYIMNTDIRSMDSPIVVMLRNEFFILIDISTNLLLWFIMMLTGEFVFSLCWYWGRGEGENHSELGWRSYQTPIGSNWTQTRPYQIQILKYKYRHIKFKYTNVNMRRSQML